MGESTQAGNLMTQLGGSALGSVVGEGMGLLFNGINNSNQLAQQGRLDQQQLGFNEQQTAYNEAQQLNMWQETNYPAQVQELEKAGLNPALLYGSHGGGGATTGSIGQSIQAPQAPSQSAAQTGQMAVQTAATQSEINLNNAQAAKIQAETPGAAGLQGAQTANQAAGAQSQQAQAALTQMNTIAQGIQNTIQGQTQDDQIASIRAAASQIEQTAQQAVRNNYIDQNTMDQKIKQAQADLIGTYLKNNLTTAQTTQTGSQTQLNQADANKAIATVKQQWQQLNINKTNANTQQGQLQLQQLIQNIPESTRLWAQPLLNNLIPHIFL